MVLAHKLPNQSTHSLTRNFPWCLRQKPKCVLDTYHYWEIDWLGCQGAKQLVPLKLCLPKVRLLIVKSVWVERRLIKLDVWRGYIARKMHSAQEIGDKIGDKTSNICAKCWARNSGDSRVITVVTNCHILHHTRNASHENRMQKYFSISQENIMRTEYSERTSTIHHTADECWLIIFDVYAHWLSIVGAFSGNGLTRRSEIITK